MGWAVGWDPKWQRDVGYGVPSICDQPGCSKRIDRGLSYVCGHEPMGGEHGCGLYFCSEISPVPFVDGTALDEIEDAIAWDDSEVEWVDVCERCSKNQQPFDPTPDTDEWRNWKLTDESWQRWRDENPVEVEKIRRDIAYAHRGEVIPGSGEPVEPRDFR